MDINWSAILNVAMGIAMGLVGFLAWSLRHAFTGGYEGAKLVGRLQQVEVDLARVLKEQSALESRQESYERITTQTVEKLTFKVDTMDMAVKAFTGRMDDAVRRLSDLTDDVQRLPDTMRLMFVAKEGGEVTTWVVEQRHVASQITEIWKHVNQIRDRVTAIASSFRKGTVDD